MEIERKFLTSRSFLKGKDITDVFVIQQYYLSITPETRYRRRLSTNGEEYFLTIKSDGLLAREEDEKTINKREFFKHISKKQGSFIWKVRTVVTHLGHSMECDTFIEPYTDDLMVEIEFPTDEAAHAFVPPPEFREVTDDKRYKNKNLVINGFPL